MMAGGGAPVPQSFGSPYAPAGGYRMDSRHPQGNMFGTMDDSMLARMEASLAAVADMKAHHMPQHPVQQFKTDSHHPELNYMNTYNKPHFTFTGEGMIDSSGSMQAPNLMVGSGGQFTNSLTQLTSMAPPTISSSSSDHHTNYSMYSHNTAVSMLPQMSMSHPAIMQTVQEVDCDPRELENFAERFKQRRIKLGVTQADVGKALGNLKLPGVGSLSQSTICRFESLTLSHNNMIALKPVLSAWLDDAERIARERHSSMMLDGTSLDKKRKRTSIAAPEKRSLEAYFAIQPRPSGEKIAQIAEKLDLKKNVVRVWFCNQRQKQKRMKFAAVGQGH